MIVSLIVAVGRKHEIGKDGRMPWHLPADLKHFKAMTLGKPVIMGRKTLDSIGRPLPDRRNVVITRDRRFQAAGCEVVHSLEEALKRVEPAVEAMVIGGGEIYRAAWQQAKRVYLTRIDAEVPGADTFFPELAPGEWREVNRVDHRSDAKNPYAYSFLLYEKV